MRDNPHGANLLEEAGRTLKTIVLPTLSKEVRYSALMVLRAITLVENELRADHLFEKEIEGDLQRFLKSDESGEGLQMVLSERIREGTYDSSEEIYKLLCRMVDFKLNETNPSG